MNKLQITIRMLLSASFTLGLPFTPVQAAPQYIITDLGTVGGTYSNGVVINEAGQVAGYSNVSGNGALHPLLWQEATGPQDLGTLGGTQALALGINASGLVVGNSQVTGNTSTRAFVRTVAGMVSLPTLGGATGRATAISDNGVITGAASLVGNTAEHGAVWASATATTATNLLTFGGSNGQGNDINLNGQVVGYAENAARVTHAALWVPPYNLAPQDLGTLGGTYSEASSINSVGQVTGVTSLAGDTQFRGFLWQPGSGMVDIGMLTPTSTFTAGNDINATGDIVGSSTTAGGALKRAFVRKAGTTTLADLNGMVLPNSGWVFTEARSVNNNGQISGVGTFTKVDTLNNLNRVEHHAYLLTPDKIKPTITCPATVTTTGIQPAGIGQAIASDNLDPSVTVTNNRPATFPAGTTTVVWTATDANGNAANCSQSVQIGGDTTPPVVTFQLTPTPSASGWYLTLPNLTWSVTDAQSAISARTGCVNTVAIPNTTGQVFSCSATSAGGTTGPITTTVKVDNTLPTLIGTPANSTVRATSIAGAVVTYFNPTAIDTISLVSSAGVSCSPASGSTLPLGANTVTCSVSDNAGNSSTSSFVVTVADQTPPQVNFQISPAAPAASGWYTTAPSVSWNIADPESTISNRIGCLAVAPVADTVGQTFSCSAISAGGTTGPVVSPTVKVDTVAPALAGVPASFTSPATTSTGAVLTYTAPTATDTLSGVTIAGVRCTPASGSTFAIGNTSVNCSASDVAGNTTTASFVVSVTDQTPPTFTSCPATVSITQGQTLPQPTATDNVSAPTVIRSPAGTLPIGTTPVVWTATDQAGLTATCSQQVTVSAAPTAVTETLRITGAQCKVKSSTSGEWSVQGTSTVSTNNTVVIFKGAAVPTDLTTNILGSATVRSGNWQFTAKPGPACVSPISIRSSLGTVVNNRAVTN
jgi:probable HAF family extracellular repeat protein